MNKASSSPYVLGSGRDRSMVVNRETEIERILDVCTRRTAGDLLTRHQVCEVVNKMLAIDKTYLSYPSDEECVIALNVVEKTALGAWIEGLHDTPRHGEERNSGLRALVSFIFYLGRRPDTAFEPAAGASND